MSEPPRPGPATDRSLEGPAFAPHARPPLCFPLTRRALVGQQLLGMALYSLCMALHLAGCLVLIDLTSQHPTRAWTGVLTIGLYLWLVLFLLPASTKLRLESAAMEGQFDDIGSHERLLWQIRKEEFVDDPRTRDAHWTFLLPCWMDGHHHATEQTLWPNWHVWTIIEAAGELAFRTLLELIWGQVQTCLNQRVIKHVVVFATGDKREARHLGERS